MNNSSTRNIIIILFILVILSGYNFFQRPFLRYAEKIRTQDEPIAEEILEPTKTPLQLELETLTPEEKIWQLIALPVSLSSIKESSIAGELQNISDSSPGFITVFGSKISMETMKGFSKSLPVSRGGYIPLVAVDHEGGTVQRLSGKGFISLPSWKEICQESTGKKLSLFEDSARELRSVGVNIVFAPVLDSPRTGSFLRSRACEDQTETLASAKNYIQAFGSQGILSVVKHYPGIGSVTKDLHFNQEEIYIESQDTAPFESIFKSFPNIGVMSAHTVITGRTESLPCSLSSICLDPFPIHFPQVVIFTDALEMKSAITTKENGEERSLSETALLAVMAGNDVLVFGEKVAYEVLQEIVVFLESIYEADQDFKEKVDFSVEKILNLKFPEEIKS